MAIQILTVSSKGQISIPASIRRLLSIQTGDKLAAYTYGDTIMLKAIKIPTEEEFASSLKEAQEWAASAGYTEDDIEDIIKSVRKKKSDEDCN